LSRGEVAVNGDWLIGELSQELARGDALSAHYSLYALAGKACLAGRARNAGLRISLRMSSIVMIHGCSID
jgi:hypothetical protein